MPGSTASCWGKWHPLLVDRLRKFLAELTMQRFRLAMQPDSQAPVPLEVVAEYAAGSIIGLITWWLENDMPHLPRRVLPPNPASHRLWPLLGRRHRVPKEQDKCSKLAKFGMASAMRSPYQIRIFPIPNHRKHSMQ